MLVMPGVASMKPATTCVVSLPAYTSAMLFVRRLTPAWGADYVNIAVTGTCTCSSEALHRELRRYEDTHGRHRPDLHGDVAIDIDIVTYGEDVLKPADMAQPWLGRALELIHDC